MSRERKEKGIDLHAHTTASDGIFTPVKLIQHAISNNVVALAITDHDTVSGLKDGLAYAESINFHLIPGIEFSIDFSPGLFHLLGLYINYENPELIATIKKIKKQRKERAFRIIEDLTDHGLDLSMHDVLREAKGGVIGKPHIARLMIKEGYCKDIKEVFQHYMISGKPGYVKRERISLSDAISLIKNSGGISILAHPVTIHFDTFEEFDKMIEGYVNQGLDGMEVYSSMHSMEEVHGFCEIAKKYNLIISGGSDFHGDKKGEDIGYYDDGEIIPVELLYEIEKHKNEKAG